jgi:hypothetical protein
MHNTGLVAIYHEVLGEELGWSRDTGSQDCSQQDQLNVLKINILKSLYQLSHKCNTSTDQVEN